jgi:hypothetical protein
MMPSFISRPVTPSQRCPAALAGIAASALSDQAGPVLATAPSDRQPCGPASRRGGQGRRGGAAGRRTRRPLSRHIGEGLAEARGGAGRRVQAGCNEGSCPSACPARWCWYRHLDLNRGAYYFQGAYYLRISRSAANQGSCGPPHPPPQNNPTTHSHHNGAVSRRTAEARAAGIIQGNPKARMAVGGVEFSACPPAVFAVITRAI